MTNFILYRENGLLFFQLLLKMQKQ